MPTRQQAQDAWARNFAARLAIMAQRIGDVDEYAQGVANYLGVDVSEIRGSESGQAILNTFDQNTDLSAEEIQNRVVEGVEGANTFEEAVSDLAEKWDSNYAAAYTGS